MTITDRLRIEHVMLRNMMEAMSQWLTQSMSADALRERAAMLAVAIEDHAVREEQQLFVPLRACSSAAQHVIDKMELVHNEVRDLFEEITDPTRDLNERLWTILMLTGEHFDTEETAVFPMAEALMGAERLTQLADNVDS